METMIINKKKAIRAIETEPVLRPESWFHNLVDPKNCSVCAIGSILRKHCFTKKFAHKFSCGGVNNLLTRNIKYGTGRSEPDDLSNYFSDYLSDLSRRFESLCKDGIDPNSDEMRADLINMIEAEWPDEFKFNIEI